MVRILWSGVLLIAFYGVVLGAMLQTSHLSGIVSRWAPQAPVRVGVPRMQGWMSSIQYRVWQKNRAFLLPHILQTEQSSSDFGWLMEAPMLI